MAGESFLQLSISVALIFRTMIHRVVKTLCDGDLQSLLRWCQMDYCWTIQVRSGNDEVHSMRFVGTCVGQKSSTRDVRADVCLLSVSKMMKLMLSG